VSFQIGAECLCDESHFCLFVRDVVKSSAGSGDHHRHPLSSLPWLSVSIKFILSLFFISRNLTHGLILSLLYIAHRVYLSLCSRVVMASSCCYFSVSLRLCIFLKHIQGPRMVETFPVSEIRAKNRLCSVPRLLQVLGDVVYAGGLSYESRLCPHHARHHYIY
jgi:hypothetical protein